MALLQHHLTIASLYIGTGDGLEAQIVECLAAAAQAVEKPNLSPMFSWMLCVRADLLRLRQVCFS